MKRVELHSPIPPERCVTILQAAIVNDWKWEGLFPDKWVAGSVSRTALKLRKRSPFSNNGFRTYLYAAVAPEGAGSRISVRFGLHPLTIASMAIWFGGWLLGTAVCLVVWVRHPGSFPWQVLALPLMGVAIFFGGRLLAYGEDRYLLDFLALTLRAERLQAPPRN